MNCKALLLSNSVSCGLGYLEWCKNIITDFFKESQNIIFIPYAAVTYSFDEYEQNVKTALCQLQNQITSIHRFEDKEKAVNECDGVIVGGGNTFALKKRLEDNNIFNLIKTRVLTQSVPYAGWSAGANMGSLTIKTTNDMPIVQPKSFEAFSLVNFQINPHYTDQNLENHNGETRDDRLTEFSIFNKDIPCAAIPEGTGIRVENKKAVYFGEKQGKIFLNGGFYKMISNEDEIL